MNCTGTISDLKCFTSSKGKFYKAKFTSDVMTGTLTGPALAHVDPAWVEEGTPCNILIRKVAQRTFEWAGNVGVGLDIEVDHVTPE